MIRGQIKQVIKLKTRRKLYVHQDGLVYHFTSINQYRILKLFPDYTLKLCKRKRIRFITKIEGIVFTINYFKYKQNGRHKK